MYCNQPLTKFISSLIGEGYKKDADELKKLLAYKDDQKVLDQLLEIKTNAKKICKDFVLENTGIEIDENSVFDIQIKRLHEYKRQLLKVLHILYLYNKLIAPTPPAIPPIPVTVAIADFGNMSPTVEKILADHDW